MVDRKEYPCYHSTIQYSADGCDGCTYEMDCYNHFRDYMKRSKEDYNKKIEGYINEIEEQRYYMVARYNIEPNKVILGKEIYQMLKGDAHLICHKCADDTIMHSVCGLPITVDYQNIYKIAVCFALENSVECFFNEKKGLNYELL